MKIYLDIDDVVLDTTRYLASLVGANSFDGFWDKYLDDERLFNALFKDYLKIPFKPNSINIINDLAKRHTIEFVSEYHSLGERLNKELMLKKRFGNCRFILTDYNVQRKYTLDLNDGLLVDDNPRILNRCNAEKVICFYNPSNYIELYEGITVHNWRELSKVFNWLGID